MAWCITPWIWRLRIPALRKQLLHAFGECADEFGYTFCSKETLVWMTGQNLKTVKEGVKWLCEHKLLQPTGQYVGYRNQVPEYRIPFVHLPADTPKGRKGEDIPVHSTGPDNPPQLRRPLNRPASPPLPGPNTDGVNLDAVDSSSPTIPRINSAPVSLSSPTADLVDSDLVDLSSPPTAPLNASTPSESGPPKSDTPSVDNLLTSCEKSVDKASFDANLGGPFLPAEGDRFYQSRGTKNGQLHNLSNESVQGIYPANSDFQQDSGIQKPLEVIVENDSQQAQTGQKLTKEQKAEQRKAERQKFLANAKPIDRPLRSQAALARVQQRTAAVDDPGDRLP